ncbi:fasciclin domain-containing protein [Sciscionella sediminilitoris]|uniref:fasciclin domain-containing protein n=1 Tax=Sciscionella sediminilitoris TaxID=1445613 RepID=UPI0004DEF796|nr:fasciclin domain-containing protein [Sciscionella sp. SE31]
MRSGFPAVTAVKKAELVGTLNSVKDIQLNNGTFTSLTGQSIRTGGSGTSFTVNDNAKIICGNVRTANAVVYIIDGVLMPSS